MTLQSRRTSRVRASVLALFLTTGATLGAAAPAAAGSTTNAPSCSGLAAVSAVSYKGVRADGKTRVDYGSQKLTATIPGTTKINRNLNFGALTTSNKIQPGDAVTATFTRKAGCAGTQIGIATYRTLTSPSQAASYAEFLAGQRLYASSTTRTASRLTVKVPTIAGGTTTTAGCTNRHLDTGRTGNGNGGDSASGNQYASTCDGSPSRNGNGGGAASGRPCAGCVGNADNKNPPGQTPNGTDANVGYQCDSNSGVGRSNPAHTGCAGGDFQFDLFTGPVLPTLSLTNDYFGPPGPSIAYTWSAR
jgi:hypothetical protein